MRLADLSPLLHESGALILSSIADSARLEDGRASESVTDWIDAHLAKTFGRRQQILPVTSLLRHLMSPNCRGPLISKSGYMAQLHMDISFQLDSPDLTPWFTRLCNSLCEHSSAEEDCSLPTGDLMHLSKLEKDDKISVYSICYYPAESRMQVAANDLIVNLEPNGFCSLRYSSILDQFNLNILPINDFKNCALLIKAWCMLEAPRLLYVEDSPDLSRTHSEIFDIVTNERTVEIMVMWLFNSGMMDDEALRSTLSGILDEDISPSDFSNSPFLVLIFFLRYFSAFDWSHWGVGVTGLFALKPKYDHSATTTAALDEGNGAAHGRGLFEASTGPCNPILTAVVEGHRSAYMANVNPFLPQPEVAESSPVYTPFSESPETLSRQNSDYNSENPTIDVTHFIKPALDVPQCAPSPAPYPCLSSVSSDDVCIIHPVTGANTCNRKRSSTAASSRSEKHVALSRMFSDGVRMISASLTSAWLSCCDQTETEKEMESNQQPSSASVSAAHRLAEECCPVIFASTRSTSKTSEGQVTDLLAVMQINAYLADTQKENIVQASPPAPLTPCRVGEYVTRNPPTDQSMFEGVYDSLSTGQRTPLGAWGETSVMQLKGPVDANHMYRRSSSSSRCSMSPNTRAAEQNFFETAALQAFKLESKRDYPVERGSEISPTLSAHGTYVHNVETPPLSRNSSASLFVPRAGAFNAKIPPHAIQPFVKKEEQVWVPGKFSGEKFPSEKSHSPGLTPTLSSRESSFNCHLGSPTSVSNNLSKEGSFNLSRDNSRFRMLSSGGLSSRGMSNSGLVPAAVPIEKGSNSPVPHSHGMGYGMGPSLGPGLLTGKNAIMHSRSYDGCATDVSGSYPFASGRNADSLDSQLDSGEYTGTSDRQRANQLALAGRQQITRQKSQMAPQMHGSGTGVGLGLREDAPVPSNLNSGQRSPVMTLLQQRLSAPGLSQSSPHLLSEASPHLSRTTSVHPCHTSALYHSTSTSTSIPNPFPQSLPGANELDTDGLRLSYKYKTDFEAQLPSFLRDL